MSEIKEHLQEVDTHLSKLDQSLMALDESDSQYKKLSSNIIQKIWHGSENVELALQKLGCSGVSSATELNTKLHLMHYNEVAQDSITKGMDGELTSFILTPEYIRSEILKLPMFKDSVYHKDIGMIYRASPTFLTRAIKNTRTLMFLVAIPVIKADDVSPMYRVTNMGYWDSDHYFKYLLPELFYFAKNNNDQHVATPAIEKCRHK
ncbi:unnamed protein product [Bemisia tabaci]|uniref:Uncharacterized protein n=1 Tax=Bemisia tabaci TaxID=7038 RepID=A0A9P0AHD6_BEMTA|nr:unnamed protein product [Bemisia tabaci]